MKKYVYMICFLVLSFVMGACSDDDELVINPTATGTLTDKDGNEYHWVRIGNLDWMTENLRCDAPFYEDVYNPKWTNDFGYGLGLDGSLSDWKQWYADYGNYYTWQEAVDNAPEGWRLPTDEDFKTLERELGMKAADVEMEGWRSGVSFLLVQNGVGTSLNFVFGGEVCNASNSTISLYHQGDYGYYWTATDVEVNKEPAAYARMITPGINAVNRLAILQDKHCLNVRYVRDAQ